jgi:hypothetical protein
MAAQNGSSLRSGPVSQEVCDEDPSASPRSRSRPRRSPSPSLPLPRLRGTGCRTVVAAAGDADVKDKLLKGTAVGGTTFKVHLDG